MDKDIACKGIRMNKPGQEEIEFELDSKKKILIPLKHVLKQEVQHTEEDLYKAEPEITSQVRKLLWKF